MRAKTVEMLKKIKSILQETTEYLQADVIAEKCHMPISSVYRCIRLLRLENVGVHVTPKGYILSEFAQKQDDTHLFRRLNGRRASDFLTMSAAAPSIRKRWRSVEDRQTLKIIMESLSVNRNLLDKGLGAIELLEEKHGL